MTTTMLIAAATGIWIAAVAASPRVCAETIQLSRMDRKTEVYLNRGYMPNDLDCYRFILDRLEKRGIPETTVYVTYDDPTVNGIGIGLADTDESYSCENGELRVWSEEGVSAVERRF